MAEPLETSELVAFAQTVDSRSLSRAAAELGIPRATIGRRLSRLESRLGARLLRRTTRSLALTDAGEALYRHARIVLDALRHAEASVRRSDGAIRGELRVSAPGVMTPGFAAMLTGFARRYPDVRLHLQFSSHYVDLHRGDFDVALRAGTVIEPGLVARTLWRDTLLPVASPAYLTALGTPRSVRDLKHHRLLVGFDRDGLPQTHWPTSGGGKLHVEGAFFANDVHLLATAARDGLGIGQIPGMLCGPMIERGELVRLPVAALEVEARIAVVYAEREFMPAQLRAFIDAVVAWASTDLAMPAPKPRRRR